MKLVDFIKSLFGQKPVVVEPPFPAPKRARKPATKKTAIKVPKKKAE